jgi:hypothetical protein
VTKEDEPSGGLSAGLPSALPRAVCDELVRFVDDLDDAVSLVFGEDIWLK